MRALRRRAQASAGRNLFEQEWAAREAMVLSYRHEGSKGSNDYWTSDVQLLLGDRVCQRYGWYLLYWYDWMNLEEEQQI